MKHIVLCISFISLLIGSMASAGSAIKTWNTDNGARVLFVRSDAIPMVDVRVVFDAGSARDGKLPGLASFTNAMLSEGAGRWDSNSLAEELEDRGIRLSSGVMRDMAWISLRTLNDEKNLNFTRYAFSEILSKPRFEKESFDRVKQQFLTAIKKSEQSPGNIASREFFEAIYGNHPYAHPTQGTLNSLQLIKHSSLVNFYKNNYVAKNATIAIVGALNLESAKKLSQSIISGLPAGKEPPKLHEPRSINTNKIKFNHPSSQTHIYVGQLGMSRYDADYFPLYVGNQIFGGGSLVSILGDEIRNKRGLSYSVYSYFRPMRVRGPFLMVAQTKNEKAVEALGVMQRALRKFIENGPTEKQLNAAKKNIIGGFPLDIASNGKMVEYISMIGFYELPIDWLNTLQKKIDSVTSDQVRDAFKRRIKQKNNIVVLVGGK